MKDILITGATGMIGHVLLDKLIHNINYNCWIMTRRPVIIKNVNTIVHDLREPFDKQKLPEKMDYIIHLAQSNNYKDFMKDRKAIFEINVAGMINLLNYAMDAGAEKFIFASSGGIYESSSEILSEELPIYCRNNLDFYLNSKLSTEALAQCYEKYFDIITLRIFFAYGPGQNSNMLIPRLIKNIKNKNEVILNSDQGIKINPIYVSDVADAIESTLHIQGSRIYNIAGTQKLSMKKLAETIGAELNINPNFRIIENENKNYIADIGKMLKDLTVPKKNIQEGIRLVINDLIDRNCAL